MKNFTFVILDDDQNNGLKTKAVAESFQNLCYMASATNYDDGLDCVLENNPDIIFLEIDPSDKESNFSLGFINELHRYLTVIPKIIITTKNDALCLNAFKYGVFDYLINPLEAKELRKSLFRLEKETAHKVVFTPHIPNTNYPLPIVQQQVLEKVNEATLTSSSADFQIKEVLDDAPFEEEIIELAKTATAIVTNDFFAADVAVNNLENNAETINDIVEETSKDTVNTKEVTFLQTENTVEKPLIICVKSYGDYRYIEAKDICYLQADNNSTDIHLNSGEMITAFKTLKHFEGVMTYPFVRIHNSYIVNVDFVSRIHTGNAVCHIKNTTTKLPFSKSYKENIDAVIVNIASGNYLEI